MGGGAVSAVDIARRARDTGSGDQWGRESKASEGSGGEAKDDSDCGMHSDSGF